MYPALVLCPADTDADQALFDRLALGALRFTPLAAVDPPDGLVLDITGCSYLFGGEPALLERMSASLQRGGIAAQAVIASIVGSDGRRANEVDRPVRRAVGRLCAAYADPYKRLLKNAAKPASS